MEIRCAHCLQILQVIDGEIVPCEQHPYGALEAIEQSLTETKSTESSNGLP
jgi:hypothetical protein